MHVDVRGDGLAGDLLFGEELDPETTAALKTILTDLATRHDRVGMFELGAHHGYYTLLAASRLETGPVVAVEPAPLNAKRIRKNVAHNGFEHVDVIEAAVSDSHTTKEFSILNKSYRNRFPEHQDIHPESTISVTVYPFDEILDRYELSPETPLVLRVDVEYHEDAVLAGMTELLASNRPTYILFEIHNNDSYSGHTALETLREYGFELELLSEETPLDADEIITKIKVRDSNVEVLATYEP